MKALDFHGDLKRFLCDYNYQPQLTIDLDSLGSESFTQETIDKVVLWKVNRYVHMSADVLASLDSLQALPRGSHRRAIDVLEHLLKIHGVDLPMASTILPFRNPSVFQIIDKHACRAVYGRKYPFYPTTPSAWKVDGYLDYLDRLVDLCDVKGLHFETVDRLLYEFDKEKNGKL